MQPKHYTKGGLYDTYSRLGFIYMNPRHSFREKISVITSSQLPVEMRLFVGILRLFDQIQII